MLGFMVAIPVGPVGLLIVQRSIQVGLLAGIASGLGAALADGVFAWLATLGLMTLVEQLEATKFYVRPLGSLVLAIVGVYFFFRKPPPLETKEVLTERFLHHYVWDLLSTFFLTLMNPMTIIAFAALFAGSDLIPEDPRKIFYVEVASGVLIGSFLWWMILVALAQPVKKRLSSSVVHRTLQVVGLILMTIAFFALAPRLGLLMGKIKLLVESL